MEQRRPVDDRLLSYGGKKVFRTDANSRGDQPPGVALISLLALRVGHLRHTRSAKSVASTLSCKDALDGSPLSLTTALWISRGCEESDPEDPKSEETIAAICSRDAISNGKE